MNATNFDTGTTEGYDRGLYVHEATAEPLFGLDAVDDAQVARYGEQGYLAVEQAIPEVMIDEAKAALADLVAGRNEQFNGLLYEASAKGRELAEMSEAERADLIRKVAGFVNHDDRLKALAEHQPLIDVVERLMGEPSKLTQDMALLKPPRIGREKPWHQDHAYFNIPVDARVVGVWIALDEATVENGCMFLLPGEHREPIVHFKRRDWQICDTEMRGRKATAVPLKPGGLLLFDSLLPHGTPSNDSTKRRWALQYHYAPATAPEIEVAQRLAVFGDEGKDVTC